VWLIPVQILIADDSRPIRAGLREFMKNNPQWEICGEAVNGAEAVELARQLLPDLVILDLSMPVLNGLEAAEEIARMMPDVPLLLCTLYPTTNLAAEARSRGISGLVWKSEGFDGNLSHAIRALLRHEQSFPPD
jgi:DNA-binding NarL/FixJ family response regulator